MNKIFESIFYHFGRNFSMYNLRCELDSLHRHLPDSYKNRNLTDIGCGDGKISLQLIPVLKSKSFLGIDISPSLIKSAQKKGLNVQVWDVENKNISGDLGLMWGVLHHLQNPVATLKKMKFKNLIIRESVNDHRIFEAGDRYNQKKLLQTLRQANLTIRQTIEIKQNQSVIILI